MQKPEHVYSYGERLRVHTVMRVGSSRRMLNANASITVELGIQQTIQVLSETEVFEC